MAIAKYTPTDFTNANGKPMTLAEITAKINADNQQRVTCKVAKKGGLSIYGFGRFPITQYVTAWDMLVGDGPTRDMVLKFIADHRPEFSTGKDDPRFVNVKDDDDDDDDDDETPKA